MTDVEVDQLMDLNPLHFLYKEWLALRYARDWALADGQEPSGNHAVEYKEYYTEKERGRILKLMRLMQFSNFVMNFINGKPWKTDAKRESHERESGGF